MYAGLCEVLAEIHLVKVISRGGEVSEIVAGDIVAVGQIEVDIHIEPVFLDIFQAAPGL